MSGDISPHDEVCQARKQIAGDVRHGSIKRVASGVGEGSMAIAFVHQYLREVAAAEEAAVLTQPA